MNENEPTPPPIRPERGSPFVKWLIIGIPVAFMAAVLIPYFHEGQVRSDVAGVKGTMRAISFALESYHLDHNAYPAWTADPGIKLSGAALPAVQPSFRVRRDPADKLATITEPKTYFNGNMTDYFQRQKGAAYCYWTTPDGQGYIIWSAGPDGYYDLTLQNIARLYPEFVRNLAEGADDNPWPDLFNFSYDPSNGIRSPGDIWRSDSNSKVKRRLPW